jgi:protein-disulfide isomerase
LLGQHPEDIRLILKHFPLRSHQQALPAALAALAAARQDKYLEVTRRLHAKHDALDEDTILAQVEAAGLDMEAFEKDRRDPALVEQVRQDMQLARTAKVRGVPTIFVNGRRASNWSLRVLAPMVARELEKPSTAPAGE